MLTNQLSNFSDLVVEGSVVGVDGRRCHAPPGDDHWWMMVMVDDDDGGGGGGGGDDNGDFFSVVVMVEGVAPHLERSTGFESFLKFSLSTH